jgi:phosphatidylserine/phosphatidylglycerophosphate/cardiolipin synthase-like enzyme
MHNKFALLDNKTWTGSFNWTWSANIKNQENVIFTDELEVCKKYEKYFEILKKRCIKVARGKNGRKKKKIPKKIKKREEIGLKSRILSMFKSFREKSNGNPGSLRSKK